MFGWQFVFFGKSKIHIRVVCCRIGLHRSTSPSVLSIYLYAFLANLQIGREGMALLYGFGTHLRWSKRIIAIDK